MRVVLLAVAAVMVGGCDAGTGLPVEGPPLQLSPPAEVTIATPPGCAWKNDGGTVNAGTTCPMGGGPWFTFWGPEVAIQHADGTRVDYIAEPNGEAFVVGKVYDLAIDHNIRVQFDQVQLPAETIIDICDSWTGTLTVVSAPPDWKIDISAKCSTGPSEMHGEMFGHFDGTPKN